MNKWCITGFKRTLRSSRCGRRLMLERCWVEEARIHHGSLHAGVLAKCTIMLWEELALLVYATILLCLRAIRRWLGCRSWLGTLGLLLSISSVTFPLLSFVSSLRVGSGVAVGDGNIGW